MGMSIINIPLAGDLSKTEFGDGEVISRDVLAGLGFKTSRQIDLLTRKLGNYSNSGLKAFPAPGGGRHAHMLRTANYGRLAGLPPERVAVDLAQAPGTAGIPERDIAEAVAKAYSIASEAHSKSRTRVKRMYRPKFDGKAAFAAIAAESVGADEGDLLSMSPVRPDGDVEGQWIQILEALYLPDEFLYLGGPTRGEVLAAAEWIRRVGMSPCLVQTTPHIIPNPLTGGWH